MQRDRAAPERAPRLVVHAAAQSRPRRLAGTVGRAASSDVAAARDRRAGEPQVYAATSEEFVAQMLNLDVLGAIAFDKGCYTGQEVIARAHYRGRVKRRLQRFCHRAPARAQARRLRAACPTGARSGSWTRSATRMAAASSSALPRSPTTATAPALQPRPRCRGAHRRAAADALRAAG